MPTEAKAEAIKDMRGLMERCTIAIATNYTGLRVSQMTTLRRALREKGVEYHVVKNTLAHRAADEAGRPLFKDIVVGPTGIAFGYGEPTESAKALTDFIRSARSPLKIIGGMLGQTRLTPEAVEILAALPSREVLVSRLLGQMQAPAASLVYVLNAPVAAIARVLQRRAEQAGTQALAQAAEQAPAQAAEQAPAQAPAPAAS